MSSSLGVVLPGSITGGRTARGGTCVREARKAYRNLAENHVFRLDFGVVETHEAAVFRTDLAEEVLHRGRRDVVGHFLVVVVFVCD